MVLELTTEEANEVSVDEYLASNLSFKLRSVNSIHKKLLKQERQRGQNFADCLFSKRKRTFVEEIQRA